MKYDLDPRRNYKGPGCAACRMSFMHYNFHNNIMCKQGERQAFRRTPSRTDMVKKPKIKWYTKRR